MTHGTLDRRACAMRCIVLTLTPCVAAMEQMKATIYGEPLT